MNTVIRSAKARQYHAFYDLSGKLFYRTHGDFINRGHNSNRATLIAGSSGAPNTMDVIFRCGRHVVVNDVRNEIDIQTASCDVGRNQHPRASITEAS